MFSFLTKVTVLLYCLKFLFASADEHKCWNWEKGPCIVNVRYWRDYQTDEDQITDKLEIIAVNYGKPIIDRSAVSLYLHDGFHKQWVEASFEVREENGKSIVLNKPLIGYDLLKDSGCGKEGLKVQPFDKGKWRGSGDVELAEDKQLCYMIVVSVQGSSASAVYPEGCFNFKDSIGDYVDKALILPLQEILHRVPHIPWTSNPLNRMPQRGGRTKRQNPNELVVADFSKCKEGIGGMFACKVQYTQNGYYTSLVQDVPSTNVKVYYRSSYSSSSTWGLLLNLGHQNYNSNNGKNIYGSVVALAHLDAQGVDWSYGCFKCEASQSNGAVVDRKCRGSSSCHCN